MGEDLRITIFIHFNNKTIIGALLIGIALLSIVLFVPPVSKLFQVEALNLMQILTIAGTSVGTFIVIQLIKFIKKLVKKA